MLTSTEQFARTQAADAMMQLVRMGRAAVVCISAHVDENDTEENALKTSSLANVLEARTVTGDVIEWRYANGVYNGQSEVSFVVLARVGTKIGDWLDLADDYQQESILVASRALPFTEPSGVKGALHFTAERSRIVQLGQLVEVYGSDSDHTCICGDIRRWTFI